MRHSQFTPQFVEVVPDTLKEGVLYISMIYALATHKCACGCGEEVVTPFSPTDWQLSFDGEHVSLSPSIGNWNFACRSHYWVRGNKVRWTGDKSQFQIEEGRARNRSAKAVYNEHGKSVSADELDSISASAPEATPGKTSLWKRIKKRWAKRGERGAQ